MRTDTGNPFYDFFKLSNAPGVNFLGFKKFEKNSRDIKGLKEGEEVVVAGNMKYSIFGSLERVKNSKKTQFFSSRV